MKKQPISIRLDTEVIRYFREAFPSGYQRGIGEVLRLYVEGQREKDWIVVGRAQQVFLQYHASCFWHLRPDLKIALEHLPMIRERLRKYGGRAGFLLAAQLHTGDRTHANF